MEHLCVRVCGVILLYTRKRGEKDVPTDSLPIFAILAMDVPWMFQDVGTSMEHPFFLEF